ncbi:complement component 3-2, partial [Apostichopus japonicus]
YVYNKPVVGRSVLKIGLIDPDGEIEIKETDVEQLLDGQARHHRDINILGDDWFDENVGCSLYLETTVYEEATGRFQSASDTSVKIVNSPYIFSRERTVQYFKKGLPFQVKTDLKYTNGRPAPFVSVRLVATCKLSDDTSVSLRDEYNMYGEEREIIDNTDMQGEVNFNIYVPIGCEEITFNLVTFDQSLIGGGAEEMNNNANLSFVLKPYESPANGNEYLFIRTPPYYYYISYGDVLDLELFLVRQRIDIFIHAFIIARGKIFHIESKQVENDDGYQFRVTPEMIPSARIVAYFIGENNHIIADSVRFEVRRKCYNHVTVRVVDTDRILVPFGEYAEPNNPVLFRITAKPGTKVSLIAVDKAALRLRDFHGLTRKKMFSTMDTQDTGCGPGGGRTSEHIFKNAGVTVMASDGPLNVGDREGLRNI